MLAWWRCLAEDGALLRTVVVVEGESVVGVAPFWVGGARSFGSRYRLLGSGLAAPIEPLACPGREREVARIVTNVLASARPRADVLTLDGVPAESAWPRLLRETWPGRRRPWVAAVAARPVPVVSLGRESFEEWFARRSPNARQQLRRYRRRLEDDGARFRRVASAHELEEGLDTFARLHEDRWHRRGGSAALGSRELRMLKEVGPRLLSAGRFHLWRLEIQGVTISAQLFVSAGDRTSYWLGGFDEAWGRYSPGLLTILVAIEDAFKRGERCLDLGPGAQSYKYRLADGEEMSRSVLLVPAGPRAPLLRAGVGALTVVRTAFHRLPPDAQDLVRRSLRVAQQVRARVTSVRSR